MRDFFVVLFILIVTLAACNAHDGDVQEYQDFESSEERLEASISQYLEENGDIADAVVSLNGGMAVIGLDLAGDFDKDEIPALKRKISGDIKAKCASIKHVAVTTSPDLYEKIMPTRRNPATDNEIFEIPIPMP
ncbi:MAG: YhcN/YlaJ family sporulation lipoprotein [Clostridiales bacterium]|jgi:hypothetical protein|nr:YhcN/YlaJ family sporulation lipoprotein [Clostridiales bacterium]